MVDTAEAIFEVDDYNNYVKVQTESALRNLATSYPYDAHDEHQVSLRGHTNAVADHLKREIQDRLAKAGVEVIEARISHLAYAPEIAAAMLQRSNATLEEVAAACGFANAYHFSRRFRASYAVPPGRYRRTEPKADPLGPVRAAGLQSVAQLLDQS